MPASTRYTFEGTTPPAGVPQACPHPSGWPSSAADSSRACTARTCGPWAAVARVSYASRDQARAEAFCRDFGGARAYGHYAAAIDDPDVDAVVVAVPPAFHKALTLQALAAGKHVLVEKPAFPALADYHDVIAARDRAGRVVLVGENDHYKPLAVRLRQLVAEGADRRDGLRPLHHHRPPAQDRRRLAQRRGDGRRRRLLRGGHPLAAHRRQPRPAHRLGPRLPAAGVAHRPRPPRQEHDGGVPLRQRRGRRALLFARGAVALPRAAAVEALRPPGRHHLRVQRRVRASPAAAAGRRCTSRGSATCAATGRCTATSRRRCRGPRRRR